MVEKMIEKKEEKFKERREKAEEFETRHRAFLEKLGHLPSNRKEERWEMFSEYDQRESFIIELMEAYKPGAYEKIERRLKKAQGSPEEKISYWDEKEIDPAIFMEALKDAIGSYTGINQKGEAYGFVACTGLMYKQRVGKAAVNNAQEMRGISGLSYKKRLSVLKMAKTIQKLRAEKGHEFSLEQELKRIIKESIGEGKERKEKELIELVRVLVTSESIVDSMDKPIGGENSGGTLGDIVGDEKDDYSLWLEQENNRFLLKRFYRKIEEEWGVIKAGKGLKEQERIKPYFTQDVLRALKQDEEGKPYLEEPAGNEEIYQILKPKGDFLYHKVLYHRYLWRALVEKPDNFYDVYVLLLRNDFKFTDKILAEVMGKDKSAVSRVRNEKYREIMEKIYNYCTSLE